MIHEVAPHLIEAIANAVRLAVARGEEKPGVLEPPQASTTVRARTTKRCPLERRDAERLDPVAGLVEVYVREVRVDENARAVARSSARRYAEPKRIGAGAHSETVGVRRASSSRRCSSSLIRPWCAPIANHCPPGRRSISAALG